MTCLCDPVEGWSILAVIVADQEPWAFSERCGVAQLLGNSGVGRVARHGEVDDASGLEFDDDEDEDGAEQGIVGLEEVAGPDVVGVVTEECGPGLGGCPWTASQTDVLEDGGRANRNTELEKFAGDTFSAPADVVEEHLLDESDDGFCERRAMGFVGFGLTCPDEAKQVSMPAEQRVGLND